jgi:nucleotide-binding universal stress UspA family protein
MFKKILVPLDGSELAAKILPKVVELAKCFSGQITLLHVCNFSEEATKQLLPIKLEKDAKESVIKTCATFLGKVSNELQMQGVDVTHVCIEGMPAREIIVYASENKMDLIAMATHGKGEVAWILGSTAEKVVTHASVPTLLFRVMETGVLNLKETIIGMP